MASPTILLTIKTGSNGKVSGTGIEGQQSGILTFEYDSDRIIDLYPHPNTYYYFDGFSWSGSIDSV